MTINRPLSLAKLWRIGLLLLALVLSAPTGMAAPFVGKPNHTSGDYVETTNDIRVKIMGGHASIRRSWQGGAWHINRHWEPLAIVRDAADDSVKTIERNGDRYRPTANDPNLFRFGSRRLIEAVADGYRWSDSDGNWIDYDAQGRMRGYGDRNLSIVSLSRDAEGHIVGVLDHRGEQVLTLAYNAQGRVATVTDYSGRQVAYGYDAGGRITQVTDLRGKVWRYGYGGGLLTSRTDPNGNRVELTYNAQNRLVEVADALGTWRSYRYDYDKTRKQYLFRSIDGTGMQIDGWYNAEGRLVRREINGEIVLRIDGDAYLRRTTDYGGLTTARRYDGRGNLLATDYPDGSSRSTRWHTRWALPVQETDENGVVTSYSYDADGNLTRKVEAVGTPVERTTEYSYDQYGNLLTERRLADPVTAEAITSYTYDAFGNLATETDPEGHTTAYAHDAAGNVVQRTDTRGKVWLTTFDAVGNPTAETDPLGHAETFDYDDAGNLIRRTDRNGHATAYAYDARNQLVGITDALDALTAIAYDLAGRTLALTDPAGRVTRLIYDAAGRVQEIIEPGDLRTRFGYAQPGNGLAFTAVASLNPPDLTETYGYDRRGRMNRVTQTPTGGPSTTTRATFDPVGNQLASTEPLGRTRSAVYDALRRLVSLTDEAGGIEGFTWDSRDNLLAVRNARGIVIRAYGYDRADRTSSERWPGGAEHRFAWDATGNLAETIDAKGQVRRNAYDDAGRLIGTRFFIDETASDPARSIGYSYDPAGNRTGWTDTGEGANAGVATSATFTYDAVNRKLGEQVDFGPFEAGYSYEYAPDGRKIALIYPDGMRLGYDYDEAGRLAQVDIPDVGAIEAIDYQREYPSRLRYPGGLSRSIERDGLDRITSLHYENAHGETLMRQSIDYDPAGNIIAKDTEHGRYSFTYDALNRLTGADNPTLPDEQYSYDPAGNRISSAEQPVWTYGEFDQLLSDGVYDYAYDENGNQTLKSRDGHPVYRFRYGVDNRLMAALDEDGAAISGYTYDPDGRRVIWETGQGTGAKYHMYSEEGLIAELNALGQQERTFGWMPDAIWSTDLMWSRSASGFSFSLNDHLGVALQQVGFQGARIWEVRYTSFGEPSIQLGDPNQNPWRLPGQFFDPQLNLNYNYFRDYDPATGRYIEADLVDSIDGHSEHHTDAVMLPGGNLYVYADANPLTRIDPEGLFWMQVAGCGLGLALDWNDIYQCDECGHCEVDWLRAGVSCGLGALGGGVGKWARYGRELRLGRNLRIAPFGNRTGHRYGRWPHYHRRGPTTSSGQTAPGQGIRRHRPWEPSRHDRHWSDRF